MAHAKASIGTVSYATEIVTGHHRLTADEGPELGGKDAGPGPYELLTSALAACTVITLRMYAERKQWPVTGVQAVNRKIGAGKRKVAGKKKTAKKAVRKAASRTKRTVRKVARKVASKTAKAAKSVRRR